MTSKLIRQQLEAEYGLDFSAQKAFINGVIRQFITGSADPAPPPAPRTSAASSKRSVPPSQPSPPADADDAPDADEAEADGDEDEAESQEEIDRRLALELQEESARPRRHAAQDSLKKAAKRRAKEAGNGPAPGPKRPKKPPQLLNLSPQLSAFFQGETRMGRGDVVKALWVYIKERGLQAEGDRRKIVLDESLKTIFGKDRKTVDMFKMNSLLTKHLKKVSSAEHTAHIPTARALLASCRCS